MTLPSFSFEMPGQPQPKGRARGYVGKNGKMRFVTPATTRRYERSLRDLAELVRPRAWRLDGVFELEVTAVMGDNRCRDADNVLKAVSDALNGVAYTDDSQVWKASIVKLVEPGQPRTLVRVLRISDAREPVKSKRKAKVAA